MDVNDTENTENKVSDESAEFANSAVESTEASKNDSKASKSESGLGAFKRRYKEIRNKKASARRSAQLELFCFYCHYCFCRLLQSKSLPRPGDATIILLRGC